MWRRAWTFGPRCSGGTSPQRWLWWTTGPPLATTWRRCLGHRPPGDPSPVCPCIVWQCTEGWALWRLVKGGGGVVEAQALGAVSACLFQQHLCQVCRLPWPFSAFRPHFTFTFAATATPCGFGGLVLLEGAYGSY